MGGASKIEQHQVAVQPGPGPDADTIAHAKAGYANAQEVIRFLDTKAGALVGVVSLAIGLPLLVGQWWLAVPDTSPFSVRGLTRNAPLCCDVAIVLTLAGVAAGTAGVLALLRGLNARHPFRRAGVSVLFPSFDPAKRTRSAHRSFARLRRGLSFNEISGDYEMQLRRIGAILHEKTDCLRWAVNFLEFQLVSYFFALVLFVVAKIA
jgi:hypothetical protein